MSYISPKHRCSFDLELKMPHQTEIYKALAELERIKMGAYVSKWPVSPATIQFRWNQLWEAWQNHENQPWNQ